MKPNTRAAGALILALFGTFSHSAQAQDAPEMAGGTEQGTTAATARVYVAEENSLSQLPAMIGRTGGPGAVSLRASEEAFDGNEAAHDALLSWVRNGGVVFLHTGAARAFGYETVEAREGTNQVAGQLYGRARAALPFGSHPLLWDEQGLGSRRGPNSDPTQLPGVNVVYYEMAPGDHLVVSHPAGTALLQVSDLADNSTRSLYAAAIAPFGRGWAVFTPDSIDQKRGDGALFARNLLGLISSGGARTKRWVGIPASVIENGATAPAALRRALSSASSVNRSGPALPAFGTEAPAIAPVPMAEPAPEDAVAIDPNAAAPADAPAPDDVQDAPAAATAPETPDEAAVILSGAEANAYAALLGAGTEQAGVAVNLLRARLFLTRGDSEAASRAVEATAGLAPDIAEVALWRGVLLAASAQQVNQPSPVRAALLGQASNALAAAAGATSILPAMTPGQPGIPATPSIGGIPSATVRQWSVTMGQIAQVYSLEPPLIQQFGVGDAAITVRAIENDNALRLVIPGATALANAQNFGWRGDNEEILLFPTPETFVAYRRSMGLTGPTVPLPSGAVGDVIGQRILMVALPALPVIRRDPATGNNRVLRLGNDALSVLARLHSFVLLNALDEGGSRVPAWLQLGVENLVNVAVSNGTQEPNDTNNLNQLVQGGGLLTPSQFAQAQGNPGSIAQAQAASIMAYFYNQYGAGAVVETLQRLGAGQNIDDALQATTEGDETTLFENWRNNTFGPGRFPNAG
jgi:hypothetical protein